MGSFVRQVAAEATQGTKYVAIDAETDYRILPMPLLRPATDSTGAPEFELLESLEDDQHPSALDNVSEWQIDFNIMD